MKYKYRVYIIELKKSVLENKKFRERNPGYVAGKPCVYVGSTGIAVKVRFEQHRAGKRANRYARKYGKRLRLSEMKAFRPRKTRASAEKLEKQVANQLQARGWGVWWG